MEVEMEVRLTVVVVVVVVELMVVRRASSSKKMMLGLPGAGWTGGEGEGEGEGTKDRPGCHGLRPRLRLLSRPSRKKVMNGGMNG